MTWMLLLACLDGRNHLDYTHLTVSLGYEDPNPTRQDVFLDPDSWDAQEHVPDVEVDWETQWAFLYGWVDGGCGEPPEFEVWLTEDGTILAWGGGEESGPCDAYIPTAEVLVVDIGDATDAAWDL